MELDAFRSRMGIGQGRIEPRGASTLSGTYAFVLGNDEPEYVFHIEPGDHAEIVQQTDLTDVDLVRVHLLLRVPASLPAGLVWEASLLVDGTKKARASSRPGRIRNITDLAANVSKLAGIHQVAIRLQLVSV